MKSSSFHTLVATLITVTLLLGAWPAAADESGKMGIAVLTFKARGFEENVAENLTEVVARAVDRLGIFRTISTDDIKRMLQHEQNRAMLGCDDLSCLAEIGGALGVELILAGTLGRIGETYVVNIKLIDVRRAQVISREERTVKGKVDALLETCRELARAVVRPLLKQRAGKLAVTCSEEGAEIFVDDRLVGTSPIGIQQIPGGYHTIRVTKSRFVVFAKEVKIEADQVAKLDVLLLPSQEFIDEYESRASTYRITAWTMTALTVALGASAAGLLVWNNGRLNDYNDWKDDGGSDSRPFDPNDINMVDSVALTMGIVGGITLGTALYFWIAGDTPGKYAELGTEEKTSFLLSPTLGRDNYGASLTLRF